MRQRKRSRWARNQGRLAGSPQMWHVLSFTGRFSPQFFRAPALPPPPPGELADEQRHNNKLALEARAKLRHAKRYCHLRDMIRRGRPRENISLTQKQEELLALYDDGTLLTEANRLTRISGNGRLRRSDGSFVDIGGSTGGYTMTLLYDWQPPDLTEFERVDPGDMSQLADTTGT